jgi:hypothetical protein
VDKAELVLVLMLVLLSSHSNYCSRFISTAEEKRRRRNEAEENTRRRKRNSELGPRKPNPGRVEGKIICSKREKDSKAGIGVRRARMGAKAQKKV